MSKVLMNSLVFRNLGAASAVLALYASTSMGGVAWAQDQEEAAPQRVSAASALLEETLVTATKKARGEELQTTPVSITALGERQIDLLFANSVQDIGKLAPNVNLAGSAGTPAVANFYIRGSGSLGSVASNDPSVAMVVDGMPLGMNFGAIMDTFDLESIEILRGPQGTLFGRNATGGAVVLRSQRPDQEFGAKIRADVGNNDKLEFAAVVEGGLNDTTAAKLAVFYKERGGYVDNLLTGEDIGETETVVVRPIISFQPTDTFEYTIIGEYVDTDGDGIVMQTPDPGFFPNPAGKTPGDWESYQDFVGHYSTDWYHVIGEGNWDIWGGVLTSITAYREVEVSSTGDMDGLPLALFDLGLDMNQDQVSQELRWNGDISDSINLTTGLYYFDQTYDAAEHRIFHPALIPPNGLNMGGFGEINHEAFGVFAQAEYYMTDALTLVLGGRYTEEEKAAKIAAQGVDCPINPDLEGDIDFGACEFPFDESETWDNFSPRVGVNWEVSDETFLFASWSRGFRSGGYNVRQNDPSVAPGPFDEETVDAWEVGAKLNLFDNTLRLNTAVFYNEFDDLQRAVSDNEARTVLRNAASADIWGVEGEATWLVTPDLVLSATLGYIDASYDEFEGLEDAAESVDDLRLVQTPEWTANATALYTRPVGDGMELTLRGSYSYRSKVAFDDANWVIEPSHEMVDLSASLSLLDLGLDVALYVNNATDEYYNEVGYRIFGLFTNAVGQMPRTYGVQLTYTF